MHKKHNIKQHNYNRTIKRKTNFLNFVEKLCLFWNSCAINRVGERQAIIILMYRKLEDIIPDIF